MTELFFAIVLSWSVIDGDTIRVQARIWPNVIAEEHVRLLGIDTPELRAATQCEKALAQAAKQVTSEVLSGAQRITITANSRDSFGRILGNVSVDGLSLSDLLLAKGVARKYGSKGVWC